VDKDTQNEIDDRNTLALRVMRLEERLDRLESAPSTPMVHSAWPFAIGCASIALGVIGMGVPHHPYQYLFAGLLALLAYHRGSLRLAAKGWRWPLAAANVANLVLFFLITLGGGVRHPFSWLKTPAMVKQTPADPGAWFNKLMPDYEVQWFAVPGVSDWTFDLTKVQVFLLIATLAGALFRFQGFASVTALALLVISIPVYLSFSWDWVVPFLILAGVSLYLQSVPPRALRGRR
jgi:hypothetical protein